MEIKHGSGSTEFGPGVDIILTGDEVATAIDTYLSAHGIYVRGPRTTTVNGDLAKVGRVYIDPQGYVVSDGIRTSGRGPHKTPSRKPK